MAKREKMRIGLLGESPNDTAAMRALLTPQYEQVATFFPLLDGLTGGTLDSAKVLRALPLACARRSPDVIVVIRDLDADESTLAQLRERQAYFERVDMAVNGIGLYLLHIQQLEALIAADAKTFNQHYGARYRPQNDVMRINKPKAELRQATARCKMQYEESHSPALLGKADYTLLLNRCRYFAAFDAAFAARLAAPRPRP